MKKKYTKPMMESEMFVANEYVAACYKCETMYKGNYKSIQLDQATANSWGLTYTSTTGKINGNPWSPYATKEIAGTKYPVTMCYTADCPVTKQIESLTSDTTNALLDSNSDSSPDTRVFVWIDSKPTTIPGYDIEAISVHGIQSSATSIGNAS